MHTPARPRIVVVGGGFGGLETALCLRQRLGPHAEITLLARQDTFVFKPYQTYVPFGLPPERIQLDLFEIAKAHGLHFLQRRVQGIDPVRQCLQAEGQDVPYDFLVIATGAVAVAEAVPGLKRFAHNVWREADLVLLRSALDHLLRDVEQGHRRRIAFLVPPSALWAGPLYELAFMLATWLQQRRGRALAELHFVTARSTHLDVLGPAFHPLMHEEFARRRITEHVDFETARVEADALVGADGRRLPYDLLVACPPLVASTTWQGLPADEHGFLLTEAASRQVRGHRNLYAVGDVSDFPIKQAFLALLQADAAAEHLAAQVLGGSPAFSFDPSSTWLMEQLDQAVFAHVPFDAAGRLGGDGAPPPHLEKVAGGQLRRLMISRYLPRACSAGNPLYAGLFWKGTKAGLEFLPLLKKADVRAEITPE